MAGLSNDGLAFLSKKMKTKLLTAIFLFFAFRLFSACVTLNWDASCDSNVANYVIYYGVATNYQPSVGSTLDSCSSLSKVAYFYNLTFTNRFVSSGLGTSATISNLQDNATYIFAATTMDSFSNESTFSSEVVYTIPKMLNTNWGVWGGISNWPTYHNGGSAPSLSFKIFSYDTSWIVPPLVQTDFHFLRVTNNGVVTRLITTNSWISTNYFTISVRNYLLLSDVVIPTNWIVLSSTNLHDWNPYFYGSNCPVCNLVTNNGGNRFFRLKF
jgi:hypothetical protein